MLVLLRGEPAPRELTDQEVLELSPEQKRGAIYNYWSPERWSRHRSAARRWRKANRGKIPHYLLMSLPRLMDATYIDTWMNSPVPALGDRCPGEVLRSGGAEAVVGVIARLIECM